MQWRWRPSPLLSYNLVVKVLPRIWRTHLKSHFCTSSFQPRSQVILVWTPLALCCWAVLFYVMEHFLHPGTPAPGNVSHTTVDYSICSFPWWKFCHFAHWQFLSWFQQERCTVLSWRIPCPPLGDCSPRFEWLCFAKKKCQSVALKRQQTTRMYFVTLFFLPILKPGPCPGVHPCLAGSRVPAWGAAGTGAESSALTALCRDQSRGKAYVLINYGVIIKSSALLKYFGEKGCEVNLVPGTNAIDL